MIPRKICEICKSSDIAKYNLCKSPIRLENLNSKAVAVTNKDYGVCIETVKCNKCGLIQPAYELNYDNILPLYSQMEDKEYLRTSNLRGKANYKQIGGILNKYCVDKNSKVIEIGAGSGVLVKSLQRDYPNTSGLEPNKSFCNFAKEKYNVDIKNIPFEKLDSDEKYDVVIALDIIEHVTSPDNFIKKISNILNKKGIAIVVTPDHGSLTAKFLRKRWWHIRPPHLYYFDDKSFHFLVKKHGMKISQKKYFYWNLPLRYILDSIQKLIFRRSIISFSFININVKINTFDSKIYVLERKGY